MTVTISAGGTLRLVEFGRGDTWVWKSMTGNRARGTRVSFTCSMLFGSNSEIGSGGRWLPDGCGGA
jgi:hypothetical protein